MKKKNDKFANDLLDELIDGISPEENEANENIQVNLPDSQVAAEPTTLSSDGEPSIHEGKTVVVDSKDKLPLQQQNVLKNDESNFNSPTKSRSNFEESESKTFVHMKSKPSLFPFGEKQPTERPEGGGHHLNPILSQSENIKIAQKKIVELEVEMERLRIENEELGAAGDALENRVDQLLTDVEEKSQKYRSLASTYSQEKEILSESLKAKSKALYEKSIEVDKLEARLATNVRKVRFRERELENRLEIVKMENAAIIRNKDEIILDLKRQIDQIQQDLKKFKNKNKAMADQVKDKNEIMRRTVKALRLALSLLEGHDDIISFKKVD